MALINLFVDTGFGHSKESRSDAMKIRTNTIVFTGFLKLPKSLVQLIVMATFLLLISSITASAQTCGYVAGDGCANTDYNNSFINSTNNAATIEYDNWVSAFHSTAVRRSDGQFMVWGERMANNGVNHVFTPQLLNSINYPAFGNARVLKVTGGSLGVDNVQFIALATNGLYAWGTEGRVLDASITTGTAFQKLIIDGNVQGLPAGVAPADVKMLTAASGSLCLITCSGEVWVLSQNQDIRGNGSAGNNTTWNRVTTSAPGNPFLDNIVAVRVQFNTAIALRSDNTVWTWGSVTFLGNVTDFAARNRAEQMAQPAGTIKMIAITNNQAVGNIPSYYLLFTDGNLYCLGNNDSRQLGLGFPVSRTFWTQASYGSLSGPFMNDIVWISVNENDNFYPGVNVLTSSRTLYSFGLNSLGMIAANTTLASSEAGIPNFLNGFTDIVAVETGGHTSMISRCGEVNIGYTGHWINGSMGNSVNDENLAQFSYTFTNTPVISICGANMFALLSPDPSVIPAYNAVNIYSTIQRVRIFRNPTSGGTLSYISGPGVLGAGDTLRFTGPGTVVLQYSVVNPVCGGLTTTQISLQALTGVLPLRLNAFTASMDNCQTLLSWQTDLEQNAERFEIEQSTTGTNWQHAGTVAALNSTQGGTYSYNIQQYHEPVMLYRLKMVDKDGSFSYSKIETVTNSCVTGTAGVRIVPNPAGGGSSTVKIVIYGSYRGAAGIILLNSVGQKIRTKQITLSGNMATEELNITGVPAGTYLVRVVDARGGQIGTTQKLIKD